MMNYNSFTIDYITAIKKHLRITVNDDGDCSCLPDSLRDKDIDSLKQSLSKIWENRDEAIQVVKNKNEAFRQVGFFGITNSLQEAVKTGYLLGDRIVLFDFIFERILLKKKSSQINKSQLSAIATQIVYMLPLAQNGRVVIIPHPLSWNSHTKEVLKDYAKLTSLTPELMSMLSMVSLANSHNIHPYTITDSLNEYENIVSKNVEILSKIKDENVQYSYESILGGLFGERLLNNNKIVLRDDLSINQWNKVISSNKEFYREFLSIVNAGGKKEFENNISLIAEAINVPDESSTEKIKKSANTISGVVSGGLALYGTCAAVPTALVIAGAAIGISSSLINTLKSENKENKPVISVFKLLKEP